MRCTRLKLRSVARLAFSSLLLLANGCSLTSSTKSENPKVESMHVSQQAATVTVASGSSGEACLQCSRTQSLTAIPLKIVTYNVHLLPDVALRVAGKRGSPKYRARAIGEKLSNFDIIGINEAFDEDYSKILLDACQENTTETYHAAKGPGRSGRHLIGSGLVLLSKFPIVETNEITYQQASRFLTHGFGADGFAAKGALHAKIQVGNTQAECLDCFVTHLESRSETARRDQVEEFARFLADHSRPDTPVLILGDFNIAADQQGVLSGETEYGKLRQFLNDETNDFMDVGETIAAASAGTSDAIAEDGGRRIDYIFTSVTRGVSNNRLGLRTAYPLAFRDSNVKEGSLSDHVAVACEVVFSNQEAEQGKSY